MAWTGEGRLGRRSGFRGRDAGRFNSFSAWVVWSFLQVAENDFPCLNQETL